MRIVGLLLVLLVILLGVFNGGNLWFFIDFPSIIVLIGLPLGSLLLARVSIPTMLKAVFSANASVEELRTAARGWAQTRTYVMASAWIGFFLGAINVGYSLNEPKAIGPALSLFLLMFFYATVLSYAIFLPLQSRLEDRIREQTG